MVTRRTFFSFDYKRDAWRAGEVRNMGVVEGNRPVADNDWEQISQAGDNAIRSWIDSQLRGRSCVVVLIGSRTAGRKWINYEIEKAWKDGKGLLGVHIHNLKGQDRRLSPKGGNPFYHVKVNGRRLSTIAKTYDPQLSRSTSVYNHIRGNLASWVEEALRSR